MAESLGYEELYSYDHIGAMDPFAPLISAAEATETLRVGTLVLNNEFHEPVLLARTAATVDLLTEGRLVLGIGTGYAEHEHQAAGISLSPPRQRVDRLEAAVEIISALLATGSAQADGPYQVEVSDLGVRPIQQRVPLLLGGHGRRVVGLAGRCSDIFQYTGLVHEADGTPTPAGFPLEEVLIRRRWLEDAAATRLTDIECSTLVQHTRIGNGASSHVERLADRYGFERSVIERSPFLLVGSASEVCEKLHSLRDQLGISHVVVRDAMGFAPVVDMLKGC
jgi:probable F420-dependent oxidoreductase